VKFFAAELQPGISEFEWSPNHRIDVQTRQWRSTRNGSQDWVIAIRSPAASIVLTLTGGVREWLHSTRGWDGPSRPLTDWIDDVLHESRVVVDEYLTDLANGK
jgi:hypothetical protein